MADWAVAVVAAVVVCVVVVEDDEFDVLGFTPDIAPARRLPTASIRMPIIPSKTLAMTRGW